MRNSVINKSLSTLIFILWAATCFGQLTDNPLNSSVLKGKVDSVVTTFSMLDRKPGKADEISIFLIQGIVFNENKQPAETYIRSFIDRDTRPMRTINIYDTEKNLAETREYNAIGEQRRRTTYFKKGRIITVRNYDFNNSVTSVDTLKIDDSGRVLRRNSYHENGSLYAITRYRYDAKGKYTEENSYSADDSLIYPHRFKYNTRGDIIKFESPNGYSGVDTYKYEKYDKTGNWLIRVGYNNGTPSDITTRKNLLPQMMPTISALLLTRLKDSN